MFKKEKYIFKTIEEFPDYEISTEGIICKKDGMIDFIDSIINDRQSPIDGNEGLDVLKFARAAQKSSREKAIVKVESIN